jgi:hypothetical protein
MTVSRALLNTSPNIRFTAFPGFASAVSRLQPFSSASNTTRYGREKYNPIPKPFRCEVIRSITKKMVLSNTPNGINGTSRSYSTTPGYSSESTTPDVETEFLIAGAGPAGASLACFLTSYGIIYSYTFYSFKLLKLTNEIRSKRTDGQCGTRNGKHTTSTYHQYGSPGYAIIFILTIRLYTDAVLLLECLRDIGLSKDLEAVASKGTHMVHTRWCHSMAGEEYARLHSWGNDPKRKVCSKFHGWLLLQFGLIFRF